jgi:hypothetical protein
VIQISRLLLGEGGFGIEVADMERSLDVMRDAGPGHGGGPNAAGNPAVRHAIDAETRLAVDEQLPGFRFPPARRFERLKLIFSKMLMSLLPYLGRFRNVGVAIEGREVLTHRRKLLDRHAVIVLP